MKTFKGEKGRTLTQFLAHFELSNETMRFVFPALGSFEGVKSRSKVILRMDEVTSIIPQRRCRKPTSVSGVEA